MGIQRVSHSECSAHLASCRQDTKAYDWDNPMGLVVVRETRPESATECQESRNDTSGKTHLWFSDTMIALRIVVCDSVGQRTTEICAKERTHKGREKYEALS